MAEGSPNRRSVNYDIYQVVKSYFKLSSKKEIRHDLLVPFVISVILVSVLLLAKLDLLKILVDLNDVIITVMSILAGFNTASIAIISSSNTVGFLQRLEQDGRQEGDQLLKSLTSYFSFAIILQLFILIISIIASVILKLVKYEYIVANIYNLTIFSILFILWFAIVLNSLLITLRNASILHNFILFLARR
ncbi:hypothetical protein HMPREF3291_18430 [Bacillus sp. HMSC76G11]|nr:hypothetical protein HMPREF3291_18430 [Bacillus sp. HMSC76G11]